MQVDEGSMVLIVSLKKVLSIHQPTWKFGKA